MDDKNDFASKEINSFSSETTSCTSNDVSNTHSPTLTVQMNSTQGAAAYEVPEHSVNAGIVPTAALGAVQGESTLMEVSTHTSAAAAATGQPPSQILLSPIHSQSVNSVFANSLPMMTSHIVPTQYNRNLPNSTAIDYNFVNESNAAMNMRHNLQSQAYIPTGAGSVYGQTASIGYICNAFTGATVTPNYTQPAATNMRPNTQSQAYIPTGAGSVYEQRASMDNICNAFTNAAVNQNYTQPAVSLQYYQPTYNHQGVNLLNNTQPAVFRVRPSEFTLSSAQVATRQVISKDLPLFSGKPEEWPMFIASYEQSTERCGFSDQENLIRLQKCLKGAALEAVRGKLMVPTTVHQAIETLRMLYGRPEIIHQIMQRKLRDEQAVKSDKLETLVQFALAVQNYRTTMEALGLVGYLNDPMLLHHLIGKLPCDLKLDWARFSSTLASTNIAVFDDWLFKLAACASTVVPIGGVPMEPKTEERRVGKTTKSRVMMHNVENNNTNKIVKNISEGKPLCRKCSGDHFLSNCEKFRELAVQERWCFVREEKLCVRCLRKHFVKHCRDKARCGIEGCDKIHNQLLHGPPCGEARVVNGDKSKKNEQTTATILHAEAHQFNKTGTLFRYVPVKIYGKEKSIQTYALIDEGSACTLIESRMAKDLGLDGPMSELCLRWTGDITHNETASKCVTFDISALGTHAHRFTLRNVRTISNLDLPVQSFAKSEWRNRQLQSLPIDEYQNACASIIIGIDNAKLGVPLAVKEVEGGNLIATKSRLGWAVYGSDSKGTPKHNRVMHICTCVSDKNIDEMVKANFSLEAVGVSVNCGSLQSKDNERAQTIMKKTVRYLQTEKRWETGLLWRYDQIDLPDSFPMAMHRLRCLEAKMARDDDLKLFMNNQIRTYEEQGYVRKLQKHEIARKGKAWFIPIFAVKNKNKNKTRLVWDAAAMVQGIALNSTLLKGPDLLANLVGVLIRFRERAIAICGDIRQMFHQIRVMPDDQIAQQFLWRYGDNNVEPDVYVMQVMTFGASCSPALANYIKNENASRFAEKFPSAVNAILRNTFVDDWLQSIDDENEMAQLAACVRDIHQDGGFEMRGWISNSPHVVFTLTGSNDQQKKCIEEPESTCEKVLGMWWLPWSDEFTFIEKFDLSTFDETTQPTKRKILRDVMSIFDPLGLLGFYVVQAKIILQNIWRSGVGWDEPIKEEDRVEWWNWVHMLPLIKNIRVARCYPLASRSEDLQLHIFTDAGINAYAAVAYLRAQRNGEVRCSLVASKTRVAPLKPISIPRLELMGALLGLRLAKFIEKEMSLKIKRRVFWTDSKNVLYWINSDARKFHQFVALRVGEILEMSDVSEWRWVPSAKNVADEGTKCKKEPDFNMNARWFRGPSFLMEPEITWPTTELQGFMESERVHHVESVTVSLLRLAAIVPDPIRFSKWEKLRGATRYVMRFVRLIMKRPATGLLLNEVALKNVESVIYRVCQDNAYGNEIRSLLNDEPINNKSSIYKCSPYLDDLGVLRLKGRIDAIEGVAVCIKRPIILPRDHQVTRLIVDFYHRKYHHHHNEIVVNEIRQLYYIHGLRALVRAVANICQICRYRRVEPIPPEMGVLPPERLAVHAPAFANTGVDYFGPLDVVVGRRREKRWGVLFTCLTFRAVHIEIAPSLSTDTFLLVLKQFVSRRGVPRHIMSDHGTNFRGASRLLATEITRISTDKLEQQYPEIKWSFIPPAAPHMGGAWERMIRSTKSILGDILPETNVQEHVLRAALADIENILNSRPLTYVPLENTEADVLTPNHFLRGGSNQLHIRDCPDLAATELGKSFRISSQIADRFRKQWIRECLPHLTRRSKWFDKPADPIQVGDVVIVIDEAAKRGLWKKAVVVELRIAKDGQSRSAVIKTSNGILIRPIVKLAKLDIKG